MAKLKPSRTPRKTSPPAPPPLTDLQRCHRRWFCLWLGTTKLLAEQDAQAHARLRGKLKRHGLIGTAVAELNEKGFLRETDGLQAGFGGFTSPVPSDEILRRVEAFSADDRPVPLRGKARPRPPSLMMLLLYNVFLEAAKKQPPDVRVRGEGAADRALQSVADEFGYADIETCRKEIKRARRELAQMRSKRPLPRHT